MSTCVCADTASLASLALPGKKMDPETLPLQFETCFTDLSQRLASVKRRKTVKTG